MRSSTWDTIERLEKEVKVLVEDELPDPGQDIRPLTYILTMLQDMLECEVESEDSWQPMTRDGDV